MASIRTRLVALAATTALATVVPAAAAPAQVLPGVPGTGFGGGALPSCPVSVSPSGVGDPGATFNQVCGGLTFIGPAIGQIGTVVGPTIIGAVINAPITSSNGPIAGVGAAGVGP